MASRAKTRIKIGANGRNVVATFPVERLRGLVAALPEGDDRSALEAAIVECDGIKATQAHEDRLDTPLSIESLVPLGWMLAGEHSTLAYGAIRTGDFRDEGDGHWAYGPTGAFDRESNEARVLRNASQAGVMSEEHGVYRLSEPVADAAQAAAKALEMEAAWRGQLPAKRVKPALLREGGAFGIEAKGMHRADWHGYMEEGDLGTLPEGARISPGRCRFTPMTHKWRIGDQVHRGGEGATVARYECDAVLVPCVVGHRMSLRAGTGSARTQDYRWGFGKRAYDSHHDGRYQPRPLSTPYDCVLGKVWAVMHNAPMKPGEFNRLPSIVTGGYTTIDRRDNHLFPLSSMAEADVAATNFAIALGMVDGEQSAMPMPIPVPEMEVVDLAQAA